MHNRRAPDLLGAAEIICFWLREGLWAWPGLHLSTGASGEKQEAIGVLKGGRLLSGRETQARNKRQQLSRRDYTRGHNRRSVCVYVCV